MRRGERAATVVFWRFPDAAARGGASPAEDGEEGEDGPRRGPWTRAHAVFNAAQVDGAALPADTALRLPEAARIAAPSCPASASDAAAFYAPATDRVQMPAFADFRTAEGYYGTLAHEATHWTGHLNRLARDLSGRFGSASYAAEKLVAELGAAFAAAVPGLATEPRPDHARYVAYWLDLLRADRRAVFTAASKAQKASDWLLVTAAAAGAAPVDHRAGPPPSAPAAE